LRPACASPILDGMIHGGNATVYVSDLDRAIAFYTQALGLKLRMRAANHWAEIDAGKDLVIGLHPTTPHSPKPGTPGAIQIGLLVHEPLPQVMKTLAGRGVKFQGPMIEDSGFRFAFLSDLDGNPIYLWEGREAATTC
jgi:catechol 2,3-dioxygenase-like lactoylglutathione lyase family enzyme